MSAAQGLVPFRFACTRCGHCCSGGSGHVWLEEGESERMAQRLEMSASAFQARYVRVVLDPHSGEQRRSLVEEPGAGGRCALLIGSNTCAVYEARPEHCRRFPFWDSVLHTREGFEAARSTCPGIAVIVDEALRARAERRLLELYARLEAQHPSQGLECCLRCLPEELWATGMEADAAAGRQATADCLLGAGRPLACRLRQGSVPEEEAQSWQQELRALERELGYPASYARLVDLLRARQPESSAS